MGIVNKEIFADKYASDEGVRREAALAVNQYHASHPYGYGVDRESALQVYDQIKNYIMRVGYMAGKALRPWDIDNTIYSQLNREEPWFGVELETGFVSQEARAEVISDIWDRWDNVVFDSEGDGDYPSEITFAPVEVSKFDSGEAPVMQYMEMISNEHKDKMYRSRQPYVGTHFNFSFPELNQHNIIRVVARLNEILDGLPLKLPPNARKNTRSVLFGRQSIYGGFYARQSGDRQAVWIEGKMFRTTYDIKQFRGYIEVMKRFVHLAQKTIEQPEPMEPHPALLHVVNYNPTNAWDVLMDGAEPEFQMGFNHHPHSDGRTVTPVSDELYDELLVAVEDGFQVMKTVHGNLFATKVLGEGLLEFKSWTAQVAKGRPEKDIRILANNFHDGLQLRVAMSGRYYANVKRAEEFANQEAKNILALIPEKKEAA